MRITLLILATFLLTGCSLIPGLKMPESWKKLTGNNSTASVVAAKKNEENINNVVDADKKVEEARKKNGTRICKI